MKRTVCIRRGCQTDEIAARGLCYAHYQEARRAVLKGTTTWDELESFDLAIPKGSGRRSQLEALIESRRG